MNLENDTDEFIGKAEIKSQIWDQSYGYQVQNEGEKKWETGINIYTLCIKEIINENLLFNMGNPTQ